MSDKATEATETDPKHDPTPRAPRDWRTMSIVEIAAENPSVMDYITHWEGRALKAEALVAEFKRRGEINE